MKKETLSRFFMGLIFGGMAGIIVFAVDLPPALTSLLHTTSGIGIACFNLMIEILIWPLACLAFVDAFRLMWSMIRGHYEGSDSVRTYIATTAMAVVLALFLGQVIFTGAKQVMEFAPWISERSNVLLFNDLNKIFYAVRLEVVCGISALVGVILAEWDKYKGIQQPLKEDLFKVLYNKLIQFIYKLYFALPFMIFMVAFEITSRTGPAVFKFVLLYVVLVFVIVAVHVLMIYSGTIILKLRLSPLTFFRKCLPLIRVAGWTINSRETEPITIQTATNKLGVPDSIAKKVVLGGTTLNMDGTAIMQTIAILLTAGIYGITFDAFSLWMLAFILIIIAMVTTAGTLTGMFTLGIVFHVFGVPLEMLAIIISISHVVSVAVTPVNILGDLVVAMIVADDFDRLHRDIYNK